MFVNILLIDMYGNGLDMARVISTSKENDVNRIVVMADRMCGNTWEQFGVEVIVKQRDVEGFSQFVVENKIDTVFNFDPYVAASGVVDAINSMDITFFGTDQNFARSELDRLFFKSILRDAGVKSPTILSSGSAEELKSSAFDVVYPVVLKPSKSLVSPKIVRSPEEFERHLHKADRRIRESSENCTWLVEEYIEEADAMSVSYVVGSGEYRLRMSSKIHFVEKSENNTVGATSLIQPHPQQHHHQKSIDRVLRAIADQGYCGFGFFQALIDKNGNFYVIENNARPISCGAFSGIERDVMPLINAAINGGLSDITASDTYEEHLTDEAGNIDYYSQGVVVSQTATAIKLTRDQIEFDAGAWLLPFSLRTVEGGFLAEKLLPPSLLCSIGKSREEAESRMTAALKRLTAIDGLEVGQYVG